MSLIDQKEAEEKRLHAICESLLPGAFAGASAMQILRVLSRLASADQLEELREPLNIIATFRSRGLLPMRLVALCKDLCAAPSENPVGTDLSSECIALCFAACAYPQRAFQMADTELGLRVEAFVETIKARQSLDPAATIPLEGILSILLSAIGLLDHVSQDEADQLLCDLSAAECVSRQDAQHAEQERQERIWGAAHYLATCYADLRRRIREAWLREAGFVRYLHHNLPTAPSWMTREDQLHEGWPQWSRVRYRMGRLFPDQTPEYHDQAIILEQSAWKEARQQRVPAHLISEKIRDFWESQWNKLTSGFPYYAFQSRFVYWWKQCVGNYGWRDQATAAEVTPSEVIDEQLSLTPEQLRRFREGYRLVRTTFFRRADKKRNGAGTAINYATENEQLRKALDAIWYHRLETQMGQTLPPAMVKQIVTRFPHLSAETINNLSHRLRLRIWAYYLARLRRFTNSQILSARRPAEHARSKASHYPLAKEPGVLTVASLARIIPADQTLLWAFTAHLFLHPKVEPQRPDPWTFNRYIRELWWWVISDRLEAAILLGVEGSSRVGLIAQSAMQEPPFKELVQRLQALKLEEELEAYLGEREWGGEQGNALARLQELVGHDDIDASFEESVPAWRKKSSQHWIVPVWYLAFVEQFDEEQIVSQLVVDRDEVESIINLSKAMAT